MSNKIYNLFTPGESLLVVKKSKFIGETFPVSTEKEVEDIVNSVRKKYFDARHHCYAFCLGDENAIRFSDDGEPQGTAGRPILDTILAENMRNALVVVTRYFGGTLLGTGGLTRAYRDAAKEALEASGKIERRTGYPMKIVMEYDLLGKVENLIKDRDVVRLDTEYGEKVTLSIVAVGEESSYVQKKVTEISSGKSEIEIEETRVFGLVDNKVVWL